MVRMNAIPACCVFMDIFFKYYTYGEGEHECNTSLLRVYIIPMAKMRLQYQPIVYPWTKKPLYIIPAAMVKLQYQPTVCSWTKKLCYTGGDGETAVPVCYVSMDKKLYIPVAMVRMNAIPAYCVYVLYLWRW